MSKSPSPPKPTAPLSAARSHARRLREQAESDGVAASDPTLLDASDRPAVAYSPPGRHPSSPYSRPLVSSDGDDGGIQPRPEVHGDGSGAEHGPDLRLPGIHGSAAASAAPTEPSPPSPRLSRAFAAEAEEEQSEPDLSWRTLKLLSIAQHIPKMSSIRRLSGLARPSNTERSGAPSRWQRVRAAVDEQEHARKPLLVQRLNKIGIHRRFSFDHGRSGHADIDAEVPSLARQINERLAVRARRV